MKLTARGGAKILDFGLAKAFSPQDSAFLLNQSSSPTLSIAAMRAGVILWTAAYMSPEQAKGTPVGRRADIWAFGCVLFEMLTGKQTFEGETVSDVLAAVIMEDPDLDSLPASTRASIRKLLRRCLEKDPKRRLQAVGEARIVIESPEGAAGPEEKAAGVPVPKTNRLHGLRWGFAQALPGETYSRDSSSSKFGRILEFSVDPTRPRLPAIHPCALGSSARVHVSFHCPP